MAYIKNTWVDQEVERPRTYQKEDHADGSFTLIDDFGLVSELGTPVNADNMNHIEEGIGEHEERITALENLPDVYLKTTQITNCITEIPQRVKLDLTDGVLTLKAGSQVIVPYGTSAPTMEVGDTLNGGRIVDISWDEVDSKLFYIVQYDTNLTHTQTSSASSGSLSIIVSSNGVLDSRWSNTNINYDIETNIVNDNYTSLPFALCTQKSGVTISIDQIFNGIGYIGSTYWVDKGVKGLIANGRNADGTLKNIEWTQTKFQTYTFKSTHNYTTAHMAYGDNYNRIDYMLKGGTTWNFDKNENIYKYGETRHPYAWIDLGTCTVTAGVISNFNPKQPFRAVDYNDLETKVNEVESNLDGKWVAVNKEIFTGKSFAKNSYSTYNANDILPKDGNVYDCIFRCYWEASDSGNSMHIQGYNSIPLVFGKTAYYGDATGLVPVKSGETYKVGNLSSSKQDLWGVGLRLVAYRKAR